MPKFFGGSEKAIQDWIDQGHGQGQGRNYRPFFRVQDVPSRGRSHKVLGLKTRRIHHYLSDLEYWHHLIFEYDPSVTEIREQFALLPPDSTQEIAKLLKVKHPVYPKFKTPIIMTSDFVLTLKNTPKTQVVSVKYFKDVDENNEDNKRTLEKLRIEEGFWQKRGIDWKISTEHTISINKAKNLDMLRTSMVGDELDYLLPYMDNFVEQFNSHWTKHRILYTILTKISHAMDLKPSHCFYLFGRSIWHRLLDVDLDSELIGHEFPVKRLNTP